jgi:ornithine cyclodeaminase
LSVRIVSPEEIAAVLPRVNVVDEIAAGFVAYSAGRVTVPPVGELLFPRDNGELHIKYGTIDGDDIAVIKVATGFYDNPAQGLPPFGGLNLVMSARTGLPVAVLLDGGMLTNERTAAAGAVAARHLAPTDVKVIGILGSGTQARLQAKYLRGVTAARTIHLWARDAARAATCADDLRAMGFDVTVKISPAEVADQSRLIVTTTASHKPLLTVADIRPGTHITAMGSDTPEKCELAPDILAAASAVVADSIPQCLVRGEIFHAIANGAIAEAKVVELGRVIAGTAAGRQSATDITVADLTGVAVQDIMIVKAVLARLEAR